MQQVLTAFDLTNPPHPIESSYEAMASISIAPATPSSNELLEKFFSEFMDESAFAEFRRIDRLIRSVKAQGKTISGYPLIRPQDCDEVTAALDGIFMASKAQFRTRDIEVTARFEQMIGDYHSFVRRVFPSAAMGVMLLHARVRYFMADWNGLISLLEPVALKPYAVENGLEVAKELFVLFARAHLQRGSLATLDVSFIAFGRWLCANQKGFSPVRAGIEMSPFVRLSQPDQAAPVRTKLICWASRHYQHAIVGRRTALGRMKARWERGVAKATLGLAYRSLRKGARGADPFSLHRDKAGPVLVTRAMGGIGDLLMMQPGLEALSKKTRRPVHFATQRKFFPIFEGDPAVTLIDIEGPQIDVSRYRRLVNLSICPAGRYESRARPMVKRGRVEIFARAMRISRRELRAQGWRIHHHVTDVQQVFCQDFLKEKGLGGRKIIGIQPYSRDSYKDHPRIADIIRAIARTHDVILFHHLDDGLPTGDGIVSTAGLPLGQSLALVSTVDAMVCVDSAFLHAAAAFDIPVIALFGPTDARTFTRHHPDVHIVWKPESFGCIPCWRNEDVPCVISGLAAESPCLSAITVDEVTARLEAALAARASGG